ASFDFYSRETCSENTSLKYSRTAIFPMLQLAQGVCIWRQSLDAALQMWLSHDLRDEMIHGYYDPVLCHDM
ncbi:hypothetical protein WG66_014938, partial [Moniliophthora roreri]